MAFVFPRVREPKFGILFRSNNFCESESNSFPLISTKYAILSLRKNNKSRESITLLLNVWISVGLTCEVWFSLFLIFTSSSLLSMPLSSSISLFFSVISIFYFFNFTCTILQFFKWFFFYKYFYFLFGLYSVVFRRIVN